MTEYLFKTTENWCNYYTIIADSFEEAKELLEKDMESDPYPSFLEDSEIRLIKEDNNDVEIVIA